MAIPTKTFAQIKKDHVGEKVFVYYNLTKKVWSVKSKKTGRVLCHANHVQLIDVTGKVSQAGRARVIAQQVKNVHAGLVGTIPADKPYQTGYASITYNPYKYSSFVFKGSEAKFETCDHAVLTGKKVFVSVF